MLLIFEETPERGPRGTGSLVVWTSRVKGHWTVFTPRFLWTKEKKGEKSRYNTPSRAIGIGILGWQSCKLSTLIWTCVNSVSPGPGIYSIYSIHMVYDERHKCRISFNRIQ